MSKMNPVKTAQNITDSYYRYIMTRFPLGKTNPDLQKRFENLLYSPVGKERLIKGPILEITPPYIKGKSLSELSQEYPVWQELKKVFEQNKGYDIDRPLFKHQEKALINSLNHNIVVASGTGSGKTEAFLFPIFSYCLENPGNGVRAIIVYPLNALIEDQIERLALYLKGTDITFGKYTGQTPQKPNESERKIPNHIISRKEMREFPPNILITNYTMLEYILLRPGDSGITDVRDEKAFKFIVLDEAHTYTGAQGTEVAYLLKRLRNRVGRKPEEIRCIATSATLGSGDITFAERLFGTTFLSESLINGEKELISDSFSDNRNHELNPDDILNWGLPDENITIQEIRDKFNVDSTSDDTKNAVFEILEGKKPVRQIIKMLEEKPFPVKDLAQKNFPNHSHSDEVLVNLVAWSDYGQNESKLSLIPARYHMMVSAPKGLFCSLDNSGSIQKLELAQRDIQNFCPFEISVCKTCGEPYIIGLTYLESGKQKYKAVSESFFEAQINNEGTKQITLQFKSSEKSEPVKICTICGTFDNSCEHSPDNIIKLYKYLPDFSDTSEDDDKESDEPDEKGCIYCGSGKKLENQLVSLSLPPNGSTSILASVLYSEAPEMSKDELNKNNEYFYGLYGQNDWTPIIENGKKLIVFSDSRQDAAFFGPYLQVSHNQLIFNQMVYQILRKKGESFELPDLIDTINNRFQKLIEDKKNIALFLRDLRPRISDDNYFQNEIIKKNERKKRIYHSILSLIDRNGAFLSGLEGLGLGIAYFNLKGLKIDNTEGLSISDQNIMALAQLLLFHCRQREAFYLFPDDGDIDLGDQEDAYYNGRYQAKILKHEKDEKNDIKNLVRLISKRPNNFQYLVREVLTRITKIQPDWEKVNGIILRLADKLSESKKLKSVTKNTICYQLDIEKINLLPVSDSGIFSEEIPGGMKKFQSCKRCGRISWIDIGMCNFSNCFGELGDFENSFQSSQSNHYRNWLNGEARPELRAVEHTAQLDKLTSAKNYQEEFKRGRINVLSSSTTFEMGVDLGDLSVVFMKNVPPGVANYIQRAGRAGRRPGISPFVLTYCRNLPHDQYFFNNYETLVSGKVTSPVIVLENKKIALRHFNAVVLSDFFRKYPEIFEISKSGYTKDPVCKLLFEENKSFGKNISPAEQLCNKWLSENWINLQDKFRLIFEDKHIGNEFFESMLDNYINIFVNHEKYGLISSIGKVYQESIDYYIKERSKFDSSDRKQQKNFNYFDSLIKQTQDEQLISHLSSRGFLPSYAFPTDVVPLKILSKEKIDGVDLTRELGRAITEYAPGSQVIANSRLYTSDALHKFPGQIFKVYRYFKCEGCKGFFIHEDKEKVIEFKNHHNRCPGSTDKETIKAIYPKWGFAVPREKKGEKIRINTKRNRKSYASDLFINEDDTEKLTDQNTIQLFEKFSINLKYLSGYNIYRINTSNYNICKDCGRSLSTAGGRVQNHHKTPYGYDCNNHVGLGKANLLSIFDTDVVRLKFENLPFSAISNKDSELEKRVFCLSLLYSVLESMSRVMEIERKDIDGLYKISEGQFELILLDSISGGAGHVARLLGKGNENPKELLEKILREVKNISDCQFCNENTACYSCLFHYSNQKSQHLLKRGVVNNWLKQLLNDSNDN